jgi:serine/threonine-protein kinase
VLAEVADALAAAHRSGFVHRDLRPDNVLCDADGCRALVSDFGLAGVLPEVHGSVSQLTGAGEVLASLEYCSPEQLRGAETSEESDIYALGVMAYWIITGQGPFHAGSDSALISAHLHERPRPLASLIPDVDSGLADLLERCLAKDPLKRPRAVFIAQALRAHGSGGGDSRSSPTRAASWWHRLGNRLGFRR